MSSIYLESFGQAVLSASSGKTWRLELPTETSEDFVSDLVDFINSNVVRPDGGPEAVAVVSSQHAPSKGFLATEFEMVSYRCDEMSERRFLILRGASRVESISNASIPLLTAGFPKSTSYELSLQKIAEEAVLTIANRVSSDPGPQERDLAAKRLEFCSQVAALLFEASSTNSMRPWNMQWLSFMEMALERVVQIAESCQVGKLADSIFPAFGLPQAEDLNHTILGTPVNAAKQILNAYGDWWSNEQEIQKSLGFLKKRFSDAVGSQRALLSFSSDVYRAGFALGGDSISNFLESISLSLIDKAGIGEYPVSDFISPRSQSKAKGISRLETLDGEPTGIKSSSPQSAPFVIPIRQSADGNFRSEEVVVVLNHRQGAPSIVSKITDFALEVSRSDTTWATTNVENTLDGLRVSGFISVDTNLQTKLADEYAISCQLTYDLDPEHPLSDAIEPTGKTRIVLCDDFSETRYLVAFNAKLTSPKFMSAEFLDEPNSFGIDGEISSLGLLARAANPACEGNALPEIGSSGFFLGTASVAEHIEVSDGNSIIQIFRESQSRVIHSPIIAAITKEILSISEPAPSNTDSIRGALETLISNNVSDSDWLKNNFHLAISEDIPLGNSAAMNTDFPDGYICSREVGSILQNVGVGIDPEFLGRPEVENFQDAVRALGLEAALISNLDGSVNWPSKTSWRHLFVEKDSIDRLLASYESMVLAARSDFGPQEVFWAAYPFSASIWNFETGICSGVLLSPLHPIRLAWLASVEDGLWSSPNAERLSGVVEGWNFPTLGPGTASGVSMLAIPTDHGEDSLFLGWTMMVPVHSQAQGVGGPSYIGGFTAPGNSSTGLNASASSSAIKSYLKVNPQFSSLTIDLAVSAGRVSSRLTELDAAMLSFSETAAKDENALPGGLHVVDSLSRVGRFPREMTEKCASVLSPRPFTWRRYKTNVKTPPKCNVRLLQDPGIQVRIAQLENENLGVVPAIPYRRFSPTVSSATLAKGETAFLIGLSAGSSWSEFRNAVEAVESVAYGRQLLSNLNKPALADNSADWTVSGEGLLSPSSVASLLSSVAGGDQMLWEWRPPFFDGQDLVPEVSKRAYMTIARIPNSFKLQLSQRLKGLGLEDAHVAATARKILETLGARGMGLSGLLAMGGTHTAGAVGFYGSYELLSSFEDRGDFLVLPVDACDGFLRNLSDSGLSGSMRKADLLGLRISEDKLQLVPIEVKMYNLDNTDGAVLPSADSSELAEATSQVLATHELLSQVVSTHALLSSDSENWQYRQLWLTNLATLLETARKLSPKHKKLDNTVPRLLDNLLNGTASLEVGVPMIHYFKGGGATSQGSPFETSVIRDKATLTPIHVVVASIQTLFREESRAELQKSLLEMAESMVPASESEPPKSATETEPASVPEPAPVPEPELEPVQVTQPDKEDSSIRLPGLAALVGRDTDGKPAMFWPGAKSALPHFGVIGTSGTGKTQLMKRVLFDLATASQGNWEKPGILVLDYKGDFSLEPDDGFRSLGGFSASAALSLRLNYWKLSSNDLAKFNGNRQQAIAAKASSFKSMLQRIQPQIGAVQGSQLIQAIKTAYQRADAAGLDFPPISLIQSLYIAAAKKPDLVTSLLDNVVTIELFAESPGDAVELGEFFARGQRKIVDFSALSAYGDPALEKLAVSVVLDSLVQNMFNSYSNAGVYDEQLGIQQINQLVFVDEAHNLIPLDLAAIDKLLRQGRSFGHGIMLATQSMGEFKVPEQDYRRLIPTWCVLQNNSPDSSDTSALGVPGDQHIKWRDRINAFTRGQAMFKRIEITDNAGQLALTEIQTSTFLEVADG